MSDEEADGGPDRGDDAEDDGGESSQGDQAQAVGDDAEALLSDASLDEDACDSEDEHEGLSEEDAPEAGEDTDSQPGIGEDESGDEHEVDAEGDGGARGVPLASTALRESLAGHNSEEIVEEDQVPRPESRAAKRHKKRKEQSEDPDSLQSLKRQLTEARRQASGAAPPEHRSSVNNADSAAAASPQVQCFPLQPLILFDSKTHSFQNAL